jgi:hypothetical protein
MRLRDAGTIAAVLIEGVLLLIDLLTGRPAAPPMPTPAAVEAPALPDAGDLDGPEPRQEAECLKKPDQNHEDHDHVDDSPDLVVHRDECIDKI